MDVARPVAVVLRGAMADAVPIAAEAACRVPDIATAPAWAPPLLRLVSAAAASVVGALTVPVLAVVTDAVPEAVTLAVATARPVVAAAEVAANAAASAKNPPVPTWLDAVATMGAAAWPVATVFVVAEPDAGKLAALRAVSTLDAAVAGNPLRDDVLFQVAMLVETTVLAAETAAVPRSLAVFAMAAAGVPEIGAEATAEPIPADTKLPVPTMLADGWTVATPDTPVAPDPDTAAVVPLVAVYVALIAAPDPDPPPKSPEKSPVHGSDEGARLIVSQLVAVPFDATTPAPAIDAVAWSEATPAAVIVAVPAINAAAWSEATSAAVIVTVPAINAVAWSEATPAAVIVAVPVIEDDGLATAAAVTADTAVVAGAIEPAVVRLLADEAALVVAIDCAAEPDAKLDDAIAPDPAAVIPSL
jgi:hypothetical protein